VIALAVAGNETTRNAITHAMNAFFDNPHQWDLWKNERASTTVDELIRWATPVTSFQRTALEDVELGGVQIKARQRVGLFYASANHDEDVFDDRSPSTSPAIPTRTWLLAATAPTTASATSWPGPRSG
jgi:cholest-4-en-3-one 26-monooxygenase